jgi:hypothetical protein
MVRHARGAAARQGALARGGERAEVAHRAAAGEGAVADREAEELGKPPDRLAFEQCRGPGIQGQVDVVGVGQQVRKGADLEAAGAHVGKVARPRLCERGVEHLRGHVEGGDRVVRVLRETIAERGEELGRDRGLLVTCRIELVPRSCHESGRMLEGVLSVVAQRQRCGHGHP